MLLRIQASLMIPERLVKDALCLAQEIRIGVYIGNTRKNPEK